MPDSIEKSNDGLTPAESKGQSSLNGTEQAKLASQLKSIYDDYRTALFNNLYYTQRVAFLDRSRLTFDIVIALLATTSPIAGWALWQMHGFRNIWAALAGLGAIVAIVGPLLKLTDKVKIASELKVGYCLLFFDLKDISQNIAANQALNDTDLQQYRAAGKRMRELTAKDDSNPSTATKRKLQRKVNDQLPPQDFWMP